ncbi:MAG TPA: tripartite tricarboxylate transporter substrate binding protein [Burkholderiales bacterium]|nr:tripartite tricarboxylate transporter substrate binding protein [Burkholderiales bacterium]
MLVRMLLQGAALLVLSSGSAAAQQYPAKPVRFVVPYPAGGVNDLGARALGQRMAAALGQPWIVDNRPGRGGNIGTDFVAKAPPDGYTLVHGGMGSLTLGPFLTKLPYDTLRDFAPVTLTARAPNVIAVHPSLPVRSVKELIALAQARPGALNYATPGVGSTPHLTAALFVSMTSVRMVHIPYKGGAPAAIDLVAGQVPIGFGPIASFLPHIASGRVRGLAVTALQRSPLMPDTPTVSEAGLAGFEMSPWFGVLAPAGTPQDVIARLNSELVRILRAPDFATQLAAHGVDATHSTPDEFGAVLRSDLQKWGKVIREAGIKGE